MDNTGAKCVSANPMGIPGKPLDKELSVTYTYSVKFEVGFLNGFGSRREKYAEHENLEAL